MCALYVADRNQVAFLYESGTYANASGTGQWIGLVQENTIDDEENIQEVRFTGRNDRGVGQFVRGAKDHTGTLTYYPQDWKMLQFALGSNVDSGSPSPFAHTMSESNSADGNAFTSGALCPFISFQIEDHNSVGVAGSNFVRTAQGCMMDSFEIGTTQGDFVSCTANYTAQNVAYSSGAATAVNESTTRPYFFDDTKVHLLGSGNVLNEVTDWNYTLNNALNPRHYCNGSRSVATLVPTMRDHELSLTIDPTAQDSKALYDQYFRGGSTFNTMIECTDTAAGAGSRSMFLFLSGARIMDFEKPSTNEDIDQTTLTIKYKSASVGVQDLIESYNAF